MPQGPFHRLRRIVDSTEGNSRVFSSKGVLDLHVRIVTRVVIDCTSMGQEHGARESASALHVRPFQ